MLQVDPLREPLSKGVGSFDLLSSSSSRITLFHLSSSRPAQGLIYSMHLALTTATDVSNVEAQNTLPRCAPKQDNPRGRVSAEISKQGQEIKCASQARANLFHQPG